MIESGLPLVLSEIRAVLRSIPGLNPEEYPSEQDQNPVFCLVYPGQGRHQLGSSRGGGGHPSTWQFDTITIDVVTPRSDMLNDYRAVEPYVQAVPNAILAAFSKHRLNGSVVALSDPFTPGSTWPIRRDLIFPQSGGIEVVGYRWEVDVSYQVEIVHD